MYQVCFISHIKETVSRLLFFHQIAPPGPIRGTYTGTIYTFAEYSGEIFDSAVYLTPRRRFHIRISPRIFGKIRNRPRVRVPHQEELFDEKPTIENLVTPSL